MKSLILIFSLVIFSSCSFNGTFAGLFSYYNKTNKAAPNLIQKGNEITDFCDVNANSKATVLMINDIQIKQCLNSKEESLIFIWALNCNGSHCYSLNAIQEQCDLKNIELFIVAEYYDSYKMSKVYKLVHPILGIDTKYYKTNLTNKYMAKFYLGLTSKEVIAGKFLRFHRGELQETFNLIDSI